MISGYSFFKVHHALKLHFTTKYDAIKYRGKSAGSTIEKFDSRNDKHVFDKWGKRVKDVIDAGTLVTANIMGNNEDYVYSDVESGVKLYKTWQDNINNLTENISDDFNIVGKILSDKKVTAYDNIVQKTPNGNKPPLLQLYLADRIIPDTIIVLDSIHTKFVDEWMGLYVNDPLISTKLFKLSKYRPFVKFDSYKLVPLFLESIIDKETK